MNLNHLQYFMETCRHGSITKASEICHISQPTVTAAISNLESEIGTKLFDRVNNRLYLTDSGMQFKELTEEFLQAFADYYKSACDISGNGQATLRIGIPAILGSIVIEKLFPRFSFLHPNIKLEIFEIGMLDGITELRNSHLDCLIGVCESNTFDCSSRHLFTTKLALAVNRDNELVHTYDAIPLGLLPEIPLVTTPKGSYLYSLISNKLSAEKLNIVMQSNQLSTIKHMLHKNDAATIIYDVVFSDDEDIVSIPFEQDIYVEAHLFWQAGRYISSSMKSFISFVSKIDFGFNTGASV